MYASTLPGVVFGGTLAGVVILLYGLQNFKAIRSRLSNLPKSDVETQPPHLIPPSGRPNATPNFASRASRTSSILDLPRYTETWTEERSQSNQTGLSLNSLYPQTQDVPLASSESHSTSSSSHLPFSTPAAGTASTSLNQASETERFRYEPRQMQMPTVPPPAYSETSYIP
ncbi:hypothetical protein H0H92_002735 [Tricholoma furcatifolium]|nr:hypothetical protein H0H92_002735 [Tricholoma furcatifolium]